MEWSLVTLVLGEFAFFALIIWIIARFRSQRWRQLAEERYRILERLGSGSDLAEALEKPAGRKLLAVLTQRTSGVAKPILFAVFVGVVALFVGFALLMLTRLDGIGDVQGFWIAGILVTSIGTGIIVAGGISYTLGRRWGVMPALPHDTVEEGPEVAIQP